MKRKLDRDEIDDLLDELKECTRNFIKRRKSEIANVSVQAQAPLNNTNQVISVPPPRLQRQPQISVEGAGGGAGDMLFECSSMGPMPGYNMEYVSDPEGGHTYMKFN